MHDDRRKETVGAGQVARELLPPSLADRLEDDEFWAEHDARVAAQREAEWREEQARIRRQRQRKLETYGVPREVAALVSSPDFDWRHPTTRALADAFAGRRGGAVVLSGAVGTGKTAAAVWWQAQYGGSRPAFVRASSLEAAGRYDKRMRERWEKASSLVLDDLGWEFLDQRGNALTLLGEIWDLYHSEGRPLIATANMTATAFKERYGERIASRVRADGGWVEVSGDDMRSRRDA